MLPDENILAGVPFLYASGSQFDQMFVGVGAARIRKLFEEARHVTKIISFLFENPNRKSKF